MNIQEFPTTRYQGSKRKVIPWIQECLEGINFDTVLDAFGGTGSVSYLFKRMGKSVTFNDFLNFNKIIADSIIVNNDVYMNKYDIDFILSKNSIAKKGFISNNFKNFYYLDEENIWIDNIINNIESLKNIYRGNVLKFKKSIAYNALFQSCLVKRPYNLFHRKNLNMRLREVERHFGNKVTWDTPFEKHFLKFIEEINSSIFYSENACHSMNKDIFSIRKNNYDLVYIDPPYVKKGKSNESANYLKCYHFLEGISRYYEWDRLIDRKSINFRIDENLFPNYFKPCSAFKNFEKILEKFKNSIIVISYKYGGIPSIDELSNMIRKYKSNISVYDKYYKYALNKQNNDCLLNREYILIGY